MKNIVIATIVLSISATLWAAGPETLKPAVMPMPAPEAAQPSGQDWWQQMMAEQEAKEKAAQNEYQNNKAVYDGIIAAIFALPNNSAVRAQLDQFVQSIITTFAGSLNDAQKAKVANVVKLFKQQLELEISGRGFDWNDPMSQQLRAAEAPFTQAMNANSSIQQQSQQAMQNALILFLDDVSKALQTYSSSAIRILL